MIREPRHNVTHMILTFLENDKLNNNIFYNIVIGHENMR